MSGEAKIVGIILAAGLSKRMGRVKSLLPWGDAPLLERVITNARASKLDGLRVVLGYEAEKIRKRVDFRDAEVIVNDDYRAGQSSSLQAGLDALPEDTAGAMFLLGDQPFINHAIIDTLISTFHTQHAALIIPTYQGKRGNPVLMHSSVFKMAEEIAGDVGARVLFAGLKDRLLEVAVPYPGILVDLDTVEHYRHYSRLSGVP
jgi:molybdenum cofactor cytidylyltransferase